MNLTEIIQVCTLTLSIFGLILAIIGLNTWNYQLKGSYRFELAKNTKVAVARTGRRVTELFNLLASPMDYVTWDIESQSYVNFKHKAVELILEDRSVLMLLGNLDDFESMFNLLEEKIFECELTFGTTSESQLNTYYEAIRIVKNEIMHLRVLVEDGNGSDTLVNYYMKFFTEENLQLLQTKQENAIAYLDLYVNNPLQNSRQWNKKFKILLQNKGKPE